MRTWVVWMMLSGAPAFATPRAQTEASTAESVVGMTQSASGRWHVKVLSTATPLKRGPQRFTVRVSDAANGKLAQGLELRVQPWMPSMGHGIDEAPRVTSRSDGVFEVSELDLFMPGTWELRFTLAGREQDTASVTLKLGR
ncbi:FixH family protein [Myxococcus faecalis]|uniref:FixH family protein n=1 Tax=Myxococcus faecalis TaxID=3115646 RepID=UPI0038D22D7F